MKQIIIANHPGTFDLLSPEIQVRRTREIVEQFRNSSTTTYIFCSRSPFVWMTLNNERLRGGFEFAKDTKISRKIIDTFGEIPVAIDPESGLLDCSWFEDVSKELGLEFEDLLLKKSEVVNQLDNSSIRRRC